MKRNHIYIHLFLLVSLLFPANLFAAWTISVFPTGDKSAATHFTFESAGTNVSDEKIAYVNVPGDWTSYSYYVGVDNQPVAGTSVDAPLTSLGSSVTGRFSINIYSSQTYSANFYPHGFNVLDDKEYVYGMACWVAPVTEGCVAGQASSAGSHLFSGSGSYYEQTFIVSEVTATFKILKSSDGSTWTWDSGQVGHPSSGTVLKVAEGIKGGGSGDCSFDLPGLKSGDKVIIRISKDGAVYTIMAYYVPTPIITQLGDGCNTVIFKLGDYDADAFEPHFKLNGADIEFVGHQYKVENPIRGKKYTVSGYFTDVDGWKSETSSLSITLPVVVEKPIVGVSADNCNVHPVFTLKNPEEGVSYTWILNGSKVVPTGNEYTVVAPIRGVNYEMVIKAEDGCTEQYSDAVSRVYKSTPDAPVVNAPFACDGDVKFTIKDYNPDYLYTWKINNTQVFPTGDTYMVPNPVNNQLYEASVSVSDRGCESVATVVSDAYVKTPAKPIVTANDGCDAPVVFILTNPDSYSTYTWDLGGSIVTPTGNTYAVQNPVNGQNYIMTVTAYSTFMSFGPCPSDNEVKSQMYKAVPSAPTTTDYKACPVSGTEHWSSLVSASSGNTIAWYESQSATEKIPQPSDFDMSIPSNLSYWAAQESSQGCIGPRKEVSVLIVALPEAPAVSNYMACPTEGTQTWLSLVTYTGTLNWYASQTSSAKLADPGSFDKSVSQSKEYWVSQTNADGCESNRVKVSVIVEQAPSAPIVNNYVACQEQGSGKWADLVTSYTGTLRWYESETESAFMTSVPDFVKSVAGVRSYWVSVVSVNGCESGRVQVTVDIRKTPTLFAGDDRSVCYGSTTTLGGPATEETGIAYLWEPSAMLVDPTVPNPETRAMAQATEFTVIAYNESLSTCYSSSKVNVTVVDNPVLELVNEFMSVCTQTSAVFENKVQESDVSYSWTPADMIQGSTIGSSMTSKPLTEDQEFTLTAYRKLYPSIPSSAERCELSVVAKALVVESPVADAGEDAIVCAGATYKLGVPGVFNVEYHWTPEDKVDDPNISNPTTTPITGDVEYTLTAKLVAAPYCTSTDVVKVTKVSKPNKYTVTGDNNYCSGESTAAMIVTLSSSDQNTEYALYCNGVMVGEDYRPGTGTALKWYDNVAGVYTVKARIIGTDCEEEMNGSATIIMRESPTAIISKKGNIACPGEKAIIQVVFQGEAPFTYRISENGEVKHVGTTDNQVYEYEITPVDNTLIVLEELQDAFCHNMFNEGDNPTLELDIEALSDFKIHTDQTTDVICPADPVRLYIDYTGTSSHYQWSTGAIDKPSILVQPTVTTQYKLYVETDTHCHIEDSVTIVVASKEVVAIEGLRDPLNYCSTETNVTINGYPAGGAFSTVPKEVLVGSNTLDFSKVKTTSTVELKYSYGQQGCIFDTTLVINVNAVLNEIDWMVIPDFGPPYSEAYTYCLKTNEEEANKSYPLQGYPQQKNGFWKVEANQQTGASVNAKIDVTDPTKSLARLYDVSAGTYFVTYTVIDEFGCEASKTKNITIQKDVQALVDMKGFLYEPGKTVCQKSTTATIKADNISGFYTMSPSSAIISQKDGVLVFNPSKFQQGDSYAIYTINDEVGCPHQYSANFTVAAPVNVSIMVSKDSYCSYEEDDVIEISSKTPTDGLVSIYRCPEGANCNDDSSWELVESVVPVSNPPMFRPTWGAGRYRIVYEYNDGTCDWSATRNVAVYDPTPISMNLLSDYCKGDVIALKATPTGGFYTAPDAPSSSLINTTFYTQNSGLGMFTITYEVNNEHRCTSRDTTQILVRGTESMKIFDLPERVCCPEGNALIFGFPSPENNDSVYFSGPSFLTDISAPHDSLNYATIDFSKANYNTTYNVTYHYVESYIMSSTGLPATCESKISQKFNILNEASDFGGFGHLSYLCGDRDSVEILANHTKNTILKFSEKGSDAFRDYGNGKAVIYPKKLPEGMYGVTMIHYFVEEVKECTDPSDPTTCVVRLDTICSSTKSKSFYIERLLDIPQIELYCKDNNNAIMMGKTEPDVKYTLSVNNNFFEEQVGDGGPIYYGPIPLDIALCKIEAYSKGCRYAMSKVISVEKLKMVHVTKNISCNGEIDGQFVATVQGGRLPYSHLITYKADGSVVVKDSMDLHLGVNDYNYTVTDSVGCQRTTDFVITEPNVLTVTIEKQDVNCAATNTGILRAMPNGGTLPYAYEWVDKQTGMVIGTDATLINIPGGEYQVNITDNNGCTAFATATLIAPPPLDVKVTNVVNVEIIGAATGSVDIEVTGGVPEYTYHWTGNSITPATEGLQNQTNLVAGNYYVTVTDDRGCTKSTGATVTEPNPFVISETIKNVSCKGGSDGYIYIAISGDKAPYTYKWTYPDGTTTSTEKDIVNISAGIYHLVVTDALGNVNENYYTVTEPELLEVSTIITSNLKEMCHGDATATIDIVIEGGKTPYNVTWVGVKPEQIIDDTHIKNLKAGTYQVTVVDGKGCERVHTQQVTEPDAPLKINSAVVTDLVCNGDANGSITLDVIGGTAPYSFVWTGPNVNPSSQNQSNLGGGNYSVQIKDVNGCEVDDEYSVYEPTELVVDAYNTSLACYENNKGRVWNITEGGTYPYFYKWTNGAGTQISSDSIVSMLPADTYIVEVTDKSGCTRSSSTEVTQPLELTITTSYKNITCHDASDGVVSVEVQGGTPSYKYEWYKMPDETVPVSTESMATNLAVGLYKVKVTDYNGCFVESDVISISEPDALHIIYNVEDSPFYGQAEGAIQTQAEGGTVPYEYTWTAGPSITDLNRHQQNLNNIYSGLYYLEVVDANGCVAQQMMEVNQPQDITVTAKVENAKCKGSATGSIILTVDGGVGVYTYLWKSATGTEYHTKDIIDVVADTYSVTVTDANGASTVKEYIVTEPDAVTSEIVASGTTSAVKCYGDKSGTIKMAFGGGTRPYKVEWQGPDIPLSISDSSFVSQLGVGEYSVKISDANGCKGPEVKQTITGPNAPISIEGIVTNNKCAEDKEGSIVLVVTGGTAPYSYSWTGGKGLEPSHKDQFTLLSGETYRVEVTDANGCVESKVFTLDNRVSLKVSLEAENVTCFGLSDGNLKAIVTGGDGNYTPEWVNSSASWKFTGYEAEDMPADTYTFTVYDGNGCERSDIIEITEPALLTVTASSTSVLCNGFDDGVAYADVPEGAGTKPYDYIWFKDGVEYAHGSRITNLGEGFYKVEVVDRNGCTAFDQTVIHSSTPLVITLVDKQDVMIYGEATGFIELSVTGGTAPNTYLWGGVGIDPEHQTDLNQYNLIAGTYYFTVTDSYGCTKDAEYEITQPESLEVTSTVKFIDCYGDKGYIELRVTGGYAPYVAQWESSAGILPTTALNIYDLDPDTYNVTVSDQKGMQVKRTFTIPAIQPVEWELLESSKYELDCHGDRKGYLNLSVTGGTIPYKIEWRGPDLYRKGVYNISDLGVGEYTAYIKDAKGCEPAELFRKEITSPDTLIVGASIVNNKCYALSEGSIELDVTGGVPNYTYKWSGMVADPASKNQDNLVAGDYHLRLTDGNGCRVDTVFNVSQPAQLVASFTGGSDICYGDKEVFYLNLDGTSPWDVSYTDGKDIYIDVYEKNFSEITTTPTESVVYRLVSAVDASGCEATLSGEIPVTVYTIPEAAVMSAETDCCLGDELSVTIVFAHDGPWSVRYTDGEHEYVDGPFTEPNAVLGITPTKLGTTHYTILSVFNEHCSGDINYEFDVETLYHPNLTVELSPYICQPNAIEATLHPTGTSPWLVSYTLNGQHYEADVVSDGEVLKFDPTRAENIFVFDYIQSGNKCKTTLNKSYQTTVGMLPLDATLLTGPNLVCLNSTIEFHTATIGYADKYMWELPEGFEIVSGEGSPDIVVAVNDNAKSGVVSVYGHNNCGDGTPSTMNIQILEPITETGVISSPTHVCENEAMFTLSVSDVANATYYEWSLPIGYTLLSGQGSRNILVSIDKYATSSTVSVVPSNECMEAEAITKFITIRQLPLAEAGVDINTHCSSDARMVAKLANGTTAEWDLLRGAGNIITPTSPTSQVTDLLFGSNEFRWTVSDGYCVSFDTVAVVNDNPGITNPEATDITVCENEVLLRAGEPKFGYGRWKLIAGDGDVKTPDSNETLVTDLSTKTVNKVRWEVYYGACSNTIDVRIISNDLSKLADAGEDGVTTDGTYRLSARMINNSSVTGTWEVVGGAGTIDDIHAENTYIRGLDPGINTIRWTLKGFKCEAYDEVQIRGVDEPEASYMVESDADCVPFTVFFNNTTIGEATYKWEFGDGGISEQRSPEHTYEKSGVYDVKLTAIGKRKTDVYTGKITVYPKPEVNFTSGVTQLYIPNAVAQFYDATDKTVAWHWDFGDGGTSDDRNPVYKYQESGIYTVKYSVTDEKGCKDTLVAKDYIRVSRESFIVFPTAFVPDLTNQNGGYYNPEERRLDIFYPVWRNVDTYTLKIYNQWGTQIFQSDEVLKGWDGYYHGTCADQGTYVFKAEGRYKDGTSFRVSGNLLLVR